MTIRDDAEAHTLLKTIDAKILRTDIDQWLSRYLEGQNRNTLSNKEMEKVFVAADPLVQNKYGIDIWDAMVLLNVAQQESTFEKKNQSHGFEDWRALHDFIFDMLEKLRISPHLQDDYSGGNEFFIWCTSNDFTLFTSAIKDAKLITNSAFKVIVIEVNNGAPTGKQYSTNTTVV